MARMNYSRGGGFSAQQMPQAMVSQIICADRAQILAEARQGKCADCRTKFDTKHGRYTLCPKCRPVR